MKNSVETHASNVDLAVEKALEQLAVSRDKVDVEVLDKGGLFSRAKVRVTVKDTIVDKLGAFINGVLERMGLVSRAVAEERDGVVYVNIGGDDSAAVIGFRGETLDAFQYLALTFLGEQRSEIKKVVIDCENYRDKRKETLTALAERLADKAVRLRRKIALEPMNPFERRIIHSALAGNSNVATESEGEDPFRFIVITPVGVELKDPRPIKNGERESRSGGRDRRDNRRGRSSRPDKKRDRKPREEEPEVEDGNVYTGYFTSNDDFVKPVAKSGPPKYKSFGGRKRF